MIRKGSQSLTKQFATSLAPLLPTSVTEIWEPSRDFAHVKLPARSSSSGTKAGCLVGMSKEEPNVFVVTADGEFLNYKIDLYQGGEGKLDKQYSYAPILPFCWLLMCYLKSGGFARGKVGDACILRRREESFLVARFLIPPHLYEREGGKWCINCNWINLPLSSRRCHHTTFNSIQSFICVTSPTSESSCLTRPLCNVIG